MVATATLFVDDPGAAARAPQPDQWRWRPGIRLRSLPVLYPGETIGRIQFKVHH